MFYNPVMVDALTKRDHELHCAVCEITINVRNYLNAHPTENYIVNCHSITRALANFIPELQVASGRHVSIKGERDEQIFVTYTIHSWLVTPDEAIIEPYPPTFLAIAPILIPTKGEYSEANSGTYLAGCSTADFIRKHVNTWRLRHVTAELIQLIEKANSFAHRKA